MKTSFCMLAAVIVFVNIFTGCSNNSPTEADDSGYRGSNEGSKLAGNDSLWDSGDLENNAVFGESGFSALPGGYRMGSSGHFGGLGSSAEFWSFTEYSSSHAWYHSLDHGYSGVFRYRCDKRGGSSVRLIRE